MIHSAAYILGQLLIDLSLATDPTDNDSWPVFCGQLPDLPDACIAIYDTAPVNHGRCGIDNKVKEHFGIQIIIRGAIQSTAWTKTEAIREAIDETVDRTNVTIDSTTYLVYAVSKRTGPLAVGSEENTERFIYTLNCTTAIRQTN